MTNNPARHRIITVLSNGYIVRRTDGRYNFGFVDTDALEGLITDGIVEVFKPDGFDVEMVRAKASSGGAEKEGETK